MPETLVINLMVESGEGGLRDDKILDEKMTNFGAGKVMRYNDWPDLLVRTLLAGEARTQAVEEYLTQESANNPLQQLWKNRRYRLSAFYFYRALVKSITEPADTREITLRDGLQRAADTRALSTLEVMAATGLLKRGEIMKPISSGAGQPPK